jgi:hypothetical protein
VASQGHPYAIFRRALERRSLPAAWAAAHDLGSMTLADSLELKPPTPAEQLSGLALLPQDRQERVRPDPHPLKPFLTCFEARGTWMELPLASVLR